MLFRAQARIASDFAHIWALYGLTINRMAHGTVNGEQRQHAFTHGFQGDAGRIRKLGVWAGPLFEQGILKLLNTYQTSNCFCGRLPGSALFMQNELSE